MRIIVDAMSGDNAPVEIVKGAMLAKEEFDIDVTLVGDEYEILSVLGDKYEDFTIVHTTEVITMEDDPSSSVRRKKDSSLTVASKLLASDEGDALVTAGNTGAVLTASTLYVKRIKGIRRGALAPIIPTDGCKSLLIDCGANVVCTPEYLLQFAFMGSFFMKSYMKVEKPRVGLLNNGTEEEKGTDLHIEAYKLLKKAHDDGRINFIGNIEGREVVLGGCDVIVADGFTGNIFLKTVEGMGVLIKNRLGSIFKKNFFTKMAAVMVFDGISAFRRQMDHKETGGAPILGVSKPVIKAHGSSDAYSFRSAIMQAIIFAEAKINDEIVNNIEYMTISTEND